MLIDVSRLVGRLLRGRHPTGIDRVCMAYVRHYGERASALISVRGHALRLAKRSSVDVFDWILRHGTHGKPWASLVRSFAANTPTPGTLLLNIGHTQLDCWRYVSLLRRLRVRPCFMIHDLIPITHPQYCRAGERSRHELRIRNATSTAHGLICNSRETRSALLDYCARHNLEVPPVVVAPLASDLAPRAIRRPIPRPYFACIGTIEPRKNHLVLLHAWQRLAALLGDRTPLLVLVGQRGWECEHVVRMLERCETLKSLVIQKPETTDEELAALLGHAQALVFPSLVEGFGIPIIEALDLGVPVIASDLPVFREICGDIPDYVDPMDVPAWVRMVEAYTVDSSNARRAQLERLALHQPRTWKDHFSVVDRMIDGLNHVA